MVPVIAAIGEGLAAIGAAVTTTEGAIATVGVAAAGAKAYAAKQAATAVATRAAATVGLGAVAASAVPWIVGGLTIYQLGKLGCKLLDGGDKK